MSSDPEQEYFADGMVEEIITALSRIRWLFVIARNSTFTYKGQPIDVNQVGRELGVRYVLEGSVRRAGGRIRITAQLIDAPDRTHLWADRFDGSLEDVFDPQDKVASAVAGVIEPTLQAAEEARTVRRVRRLRVASRCEACCSVLLSGIPRIRACQRGYGSLPHFTITATSARGPLSRWRTRQM
jgi:TolB-like protein